MKHADHMQLYALLGEFRSSPWSQQNWDRHVGSDFRETDLGDAIQAIAQMVMEAAATVPDADEPEAAQAAPVFPPLLCLQCVLGAQEAERRGVPADQRPGVYPARFIANGMTFCDELHKVQVQGPIIVPGQNGQLPPGMLN